MERRQRRASPTEYLHLLSASPLWYARLLDEYQGELAPAAHELATLRLAAWTMGRPVPVAAEVWAAAYEIVSRTGWLDPVPPREVLARDCRGRGLEVL